MEKYVAVFGQPTQVTTKNYVFPCPLCQQEGGDTKLDNLAVKITTGLITCFKSNEHTRNLRENYKSLKPVKQNIQSKVIQIGFQEEKIKENMKYLKQCQKYLVEDYNNLIWHRGFKVSILKELGIGVDSTKQCWVFPIYHHPTNKLIGFEYRDIQLLPRKEGGKVWREEGSFSCLAQITKKPVGVKIPPIIIVEGFIDAYSLYHYMKTYPNIIPYWILTPSCGVATIAKHIKEVYQPCALSILLDSDKAGEEARLEIQKVSPVCYHNLRLPEEYKDFGDYWIKQNKGGILC